jgi:hypothetical protein
MEQKAKAVMPSDSDDVTVRESELIVEHRGWASPVGAATLALVGILYTAIIAVLGVVFAVEWPGWLSLYVLLAVAGLAAIVWLRNDLIDFVEKRVALRGRPKQIYPPR